MDTETIVNTFESSLQYITDTIHNRERLQKVGAVAAISVATYLVTSKLYDAFLGPLSGIPGPLAMKFVDARFSGKMEKTPGTSYRSFMKWQNEYGQIVRIGPKHISVSSKEMLKQVLQKDDLTKGPAYERLHLHGGINMFNTINKDFHKQRRRVVSPAFSVKYLNSLEPYMTDMTEAFLRRMDKDIEKTRGSGDYGVVDIWALLQYLALDIIGETAFGRTFNMLEGNDHLVPRNITKTMETGTYIIAHPILGTIKALFSLGDVMSAVHELQAFMKKIIIERIEGGEKARRNDILQILIDTQQAKEADDRLTAEAIAHETVLFLIAGSETTSNTTGFAIYELLKNPHTLDALRAEIDAIPMEPGQKYFQHEQLKHLPYLNAVIDETLRLDPISVNGMERRADRDIVLGGNLVVPKGTVVHCNSYHAHLNPDYWPEPTKFIPERWLEGSSIPADTSAFFPYSIGSRNCIGKAFAQQEMRLSIAHIVKLYDIQPIPQEMEDAKERRSFVTLAVKKNSFKIQAKRR